MPAWTEETKEYQEAIKLPRFTGGPFGFWLMLNDRITINFAQVFAFTNDERDGPTLEMVSGDKFHVPLALWEMWQKIITPKPMLLQAQLAQQSAQEQMLADSVSGIVRAVGPLRDGR